MTAAGTEPLRYQWHFNGAPAGNGTNAALLLTNVSSNSAGNYFVVVTNIAGAATSQVATLTVTNGVINGDSDNDGMPDWWENLYALESGNPNDANEDADGDRMSNLDEFRSGTNPRDASSLLKLQITVMSPVRIRFTAQSNVAYTIQVATNIPGNPWLNLSNVAPHSAVRSIDIHDSAADPASRFYRVLVP